MLRKLETVNSTSMVLIFQLDFCIIDAKKQMKPEFFRRLEDVRCCEQRESSLFLAVAPLVFTWRHGRLLSDELLLRGQLFTQHLDGGLVP